jgi:serine/threonine-protein kinase
MAEELLGSKIGSWTPVRLLDSGKSAVVFEAESGSTKCALKIFDRELVERFGTDVQSARVERELALRGKEHPHLVRILDGGQCPKTKYFFVAMELLSGQPLSKVLRTIPREKIWPIAAQVASAAKFLEQLNLVHRDIKPDNIVVDDDFQNARLLDLGIIRPIGEPGITDGDDRTFIGTLQYSSPEFLFRTENDTPEGWRALTFYQLGALLHDLIMRQRIFAAQCSPYAALVEAVKSLDPQVEAEDVPQDLILLAKSCLCKEPELRLRLVRWEHFDPPSLQSPSLTVVEERIRRRQALARGAVAADRLGEMRAQAVRKTIEFVREKIQALVRMECVGSELFPPIQVIDGEPPAETEIRFVVRFDAAVEYALRGCLQVWFQVCLMSQPSILITVSASSSLSDAPVPPNAEILQLRLLFEGPLDEGILGSRIKRFLLSMLDRAQSVPQSSGGAIQWLPQGEGETE